MICKEDVVSWFKELESYKRIDTMCTLLNMCLPFELRFLGTCLEELGRRDSQELRGIELRVNNPQDLAADIASCQSGEPTDMKIRRKMAMYLALIRTCNRSCVNGLFKTLDSWGERDFYKINDPDALQELLLVYTMATNHPVFSFEQRMKCGEIFLKLKECKLSGQCQQSSPHREQQQTIHIHGGHQQIHTPIHVIPQNNLSMGFPQAAITQMISADPNLQHQINVDAIHHMIPSNMAIPSEFAVGHPNTLTWALRPNLQSYPPPSLDQHPPQSSSPMLSQPSSPSHSRTTSPNRSTSSLIQQQQQQQQSNQVRNPQQRGISLRNSRRPSAETTPPPVQQQQQHQQLISLIGNSEMILPQNIKNLDDVVVNVDGTMTQLQTLCRNGYTRFGHHTIPRQSKSSIHLQHHNQQQQQQQQQHHNQHIQAVTSNIITGPSPMQSATNFNVNASLAYTLQNMNIVDVHNPVENSVISNRHKSGGSDSGSSIGSVGDITPPDTPSIVGNSSNNSVRINDQNNFSKQMNMTRINGRPDKLISGINNLAGSGGGGGIGSGTTTVMYAPSSNSPQQQQQFVGNEILLTTGPNIIPSPVGNNSNNNLSSTGSGSSSNNNLVTSTVLISSPSTIGGGGVSNVISSNPVLIQQHQQPQFSTTYPYHAQHLAATTRPPILSHNPAIAPPPATFRHPGFQIQPNGEILYPYPPQVAAAAAGLTFLPPNAAPPPPAVVRSSSSSMSTSAPPQSQQQQQQQPPPQQLQQTPQPPPNALLAASPYTTLTVGNKAISCFNCGSQSHTGRDCQEASMEDVTRSSVYKLDYSTSTVSPGSNNSGMGIAGNTSGVIGSNVTTAEIATETASLNSSSSSSLTNSNK